MSVCSQSRKCCRSRGSAAAVADVPPQLRKCRRSFGMAAAEDHWDYCETPRVIERLRSDPFFVPTVQGPAVAVVPTVQVPAVAARVLGEVWDLLNPPVPAQLIQPALDPYFAADLELDYSPDMTDVTDPSPAPAVTGLTAEKRKRKNMAVVRSNKSWRKRSLSNCTESDDSSAQDKSTVAASIGSVASREFVANLDIQIRAERKRVDVAPLRHEKEAKTADSSSDEKEDKTADISRVQPTVSSRSSPGPRKPRRWTKESFDKVINPITSCGTLHQMGQAIGAQPIRKRSERRDGSPDNTHRSKPKQRQSLDNTHAIGAMGYSGHMSSLYTAPNQSVTMDSENDSRYVSNNAHSVVRDSVVTSVVKDSEDPPTSPVCRSDVELEQSQPRTSVLTAVAEKGPDRLWPPDRLLRNDDRSQVSGRSNTQPEVGNFGLFLVSYGMRRNTLADPQRTTVMDQQLLKNPCGVLVVIEANDRLEKMLNASTAVAGDQGKGFARRGQLCETHWLLKPRSCPCNTLLTREAHP